MYLTIDLPGPVSIDVPGKHIVPSRSTVIDNVRLKLAPIAWDLGQRNLTDRPSESSFIKWLAEAVSIEGNPDD